MPPGSAGRGGQEEQSDAAVALAGSEAVMCLGAAPPGSQLARAWGLLARHEWPRRVREPHGLSAPRCSGWSSRWQSAGPSETCSWSPRTPSSRSSGTW